MRTRNYLPLAAYRIGAIGAVLQIAIAVAIAAITLPGYRGIHIGLAGVHLAVLMFWMHQYGKAKRAVPVQPKKAMSVAQARGLLKSMIFIAILIGGMGLWTAYTLCAPNPYLPHPHPKLQAGNVLSALGIVGNVFMVSGIMLAVALQSLAEAKAALTQQDTSVEQGREAAAPTRATWWTQDETRQELRRK